MNRKKMAVFAVFVTVASALAVRPASAAPTKIDGCEEWNWCAESQGGQANCDSCCGIGGGFCQNDWETEYQGCICYGL